MFKIEKSLLYSVSLVALVFHLGAPSSSFAMKDDEKSYPSVTARAASSSTQTEVTPLSPEEVGSFTTSANKAVAWINAKKQQIKDLETALAPHISWVHELSGMGNSTMQALKDKGSITPSKTFYDDLVSYQKAKSELRCFGERLANNVISEVLVALNTPEENRFTYRQIDMITDGEVDKALTSLQSSFKSTEMSKSSSSSSSSSSSTVLSTSGLLAPRSGASLPSAPRLSSSTSSASQTLWTTPPLDANATTLLDNLTGLARRAQASIDIKTQNLNTLRDFIEKELGIHQAQSLSSSSSSSVSPSPASLSATSSSSGSASQIAAASFTPSTATSTPTWNLMPLQEHNNARLDNLQKLAKLLKPVDDYSKEREALRKFCYNMGYNGVKSLWHALRNDQFEPTYKHTDNFKKYDRNIMTGEPVTQEELAAQIAKLKSQTASSVSTSSSSASSSSSVSPTPPGGPSIVSTSSGSGSTASSSSASSSLSVSHSSSQLSAAVEKPNATLDDDGPNFGLFDS